MTSERNLDFFQDLPAPQYELWQRYVAVENDHIRSASLPALNDFLDSLAALTVDSWREWAYGLCRRVIDHSDPFPIRMPLFERALFPALYSGVTCNHDGCARWLSGFSTLLAQRPKLREHLEPFAEGEIELLKLALKHDPFDSLARSRLISALVNSLEYSMHEVPAGVLYDYGRGATHEQCTLLLQEVADLQELLQLEDREHEFREFLEECTFHFQRYQDYLCRTDLFADYPGYLDWWNQRSSYGDI